MTTILVTGASGLLGATLLPWLRRCGHTVLGQGFRTPANHRIDYQVDLREYASTAEMLERSRPECIINLAALTDVDGCERRPHDAYRLNVAAVEHLCRWIRTGRQPCHLIQLSTDQVYDGSGPQAEAGVTIRNTYSFSKIAAEAIASGVLGTVLRTNFFGRSRCPTRSSFSDWIHDSARHAQPVSLFEDILFSPLSLATLSDMIERTVRARPPGVFNVGSAAGMSKADFAFAFAAALGLPTTGMQRVQSADAAPLTARRPKDMRMDSGLFERTMGLRLPTTADEILSVRDDYREPT